MKTLTREIELFSGEKDTISMTIPDERCGTLNLLVCTVDGLEGFTDAEKFTLIFSTPEAAEEWFFNDREVFRSIEQECHCI